jgi:acetate kinase
MNVLVLNCGSSSIKYQLFDMSTEEVVIKGSVEKIGEAEPQLTHQWNGDKITLKIEAKNHAEAVHHLRDLLLDPSKGGVKDPAEILAVGHRVVHGGEKFTASAIVTEEIEGIIEEYYALAPLHNPPNLTGIRAAKQFFPDVPHVAVFDTSFHQTMPPKAFLYAIRYDLYEKEGIRRYGFHGTSHRFVAMRASEILNNNPDSFTGITCHLGNGCSLAAIQDGKSVDTSMGLTPLEGVPMGTRSGDIDPAIIFHLGDRLGMSNGEINNLLNKQSGIKGVSGVSNDLRDVGEAAEGGNKQAQVALEVYGYRVRKYIGAYLSVLSNPQGIVFTGGVGENDLAMRKRILEGMCHMGVKLDNKKNDKRQKGEYDITTDDSPIRVLVIPTNEELVIARDTVEVTKAVAKV